MVGNITLWDFHACLEFKRDTVCPSSEAGFYFSISQTSQIFLLLCCCSAALHLPKSGATSGFKMSTPVRKATASVSGHHFAAEELQSTGGKMDAVKNVNLQ